MSFKILFLGDIVARPGREALAKYVPVLKETLELTAVVVNGENAAAGRGIHNDTLTEILATGVDVITLGDHTFDQKDAPEILTKEPKLLRPANFPQGTVGKGFGIYEIGGKKIGVLNIMGRVFINQTLDCPFQYSRQHMAEFKLGEDYDALIVDAHTEATSEVAALAHIWDGQASLVVGTHTHIPTADTRVQPKGTAFQSDAGMCGVYNSSLGMDFHAIVKKFETGGRFQFQPATGEATVSGVLVTVDEKTGLAEEVEALRIGGDLEATHELG